MKIDEMNVVITGANGALASFLLEYFSARVAFIVGTVRKLAETAKPKNNEFIMEMDPLNHYSIDECIDRINKESGENGPSMIIFSFLSFFKVGVIYLFSS